MHRRGHNSSSAYDRPKPRPIDGRSPPRHRRRSSVGGADLITKPLKNDDGLSALEIFLQNYKRITSNVCETAVINDLHVWVYTDNYWKQWPKKEKERFLKNLPNADATQSVCNALMTNVFKLSDVQYQTMKNSFLSPAWHDVAGLYKHVEKDDDYAVVVRLPVFRSTLGRVGLGTEGLATGLALGVAAPLLLNATGSGAQELRRRYEIRKRERENKY